jgi:alcohol dehydrogenase class IV
MSLPSHTGTWNYPTPTRFGVGRIAELPMACRELGMARPLLVTDPGLVDLPITAQAVAICAAAGLPVSVFSDMQANPVGADVTRGVEAFNRGGHDGVIAFGGGSALDVGKAIALMAGQSLSLWDVEDVGDNWTRVDASAMAPCVAVPTTSGTGSEVGRSSVITKEEEHRKVIIFHAGMLPGRVVCDPALTVGLPANLTAAVGMDALSHNLEAYCAPGFHPLADGIAVEGIRLVFRSLRAAVADGTDLAARSDLMAASLMGATAFQKGLGGMHAMSHPIGAVLGAHHGLTNAIVMPYVLRFNASAIRDRLTELARALDLEIISEMGFIDSILDLRQDIGIPHTLAAVGFTEAHATSLAPAALADPCAGGNPVPLTEASLEQLFRTALAGE